MHEPILHSYQPISTAAPGGSAEVAEIRPLDILQTRMQLRF